jgi:hypothetical protein
LLATRGFPSITLRMVPHLKGLPEADFRAVETFLKTPRHLKATAREARAWKLSADYIRETKLGGTPLFVFSAQKSALRKWGEYQKELAGISTKSNHLTFTGVSHLSMIAQREHALRVVEEIDKFIDDV